MKKRKPAAKGKRKPDPKPKAEVVPAVPAADASDVKHPEVLPPDFDPEDDPLDKPLETIERRRKRFGRPPAELDLRLVEGLARLGCTIEEIAELCDVSDRTIYRRKEAGDKDLLAALQRGKAYGRVSVRRGLYVNAKAGNIAAQIFLAKQADGVGIGLGMVDKVEHAGGDKPIEHKIEVVFVTPKQRPPEAEESDDE